MAHPTIRALVRRLQELAGVIACRRQRQPADSTWMSRFLQAEAEIPLRKDGSKVFQIDNF